MERQEEEEIEARRRAIIEQERKRLLQEHAAKLLGYLPKVTLWTITCNSLTITFACALQHPQPVFSPGFLRLVVQVIFHSFMGVVIYLAMPKEHY